MHQPRSALDLRNHTQAPFNNELHAPLGRDRLALPLRTVCLRYVFAKKLGFMWITIVWVFFVASSTTDVCSDPIKGGIGEPAFCRLDASRVIHTPYFALEVPAGLLVGIDREGRRLVVQPSIRQSPINLVVESIPGSDRQIAMDSIGRCQDSKVSRNRFSCVNSSDGTVREKHLFRTQDRIVRLEFTASSMSNDTINQFRSMIQSLRVDGAKPVKALRQRLDPAVPSAAEKGSPASSAAESWRWAPPAPNRIFQAAK